MDENYLQVRMLNEYVFCPRLFYMMQVDKRWEDNSYVADGRNVHRRIDKIDHVLPDAVKTDIEDEYPEITRSVGLSSHILGISGKLDLVSTMNYEAVPVETKRGKVPDNIFKSYNPERVQLMAQGLLLREHGYECSHGMIYYAGSRSKVEVLFDEELELLTLDCINKAKELEKSSIPPAPLEDSPKCNGCSLSGLCMPDETLFLITNDSHEEYNSQKKTCEVRRFFPARGLKVPLYIQEQGCYIKKKGKQLIISKSKEILNTVRIADINQVVLCGNISLTPQSLHMLCEEDIPILHLSMGNWFYGTTQGVGLKNCYLQAAQFKLAESEKLKLSLAKQIVSGKIQSQKVLLQRNAKDLNEKVVKKLKEQASLIDKVESIESLLGIEGLGAKTYFSCFSKMIKSVELAGIWSFESRNRRPPLDPVNAMLSFGYALLVKECTTSLLTEGFNPYWGFYHKPRHGRPSLALDLMEEFRAPIVDSAVITAINTNMVKINNFHISKAGCIMKPASKKAFIRAFESRMETLVTHPIFDYRCSWRTIIRLQTKLLARYVRHEIEYYPSMITR